jgi:hypothetical protein
MTSINRLSLATGTARYCKTCRILMAYGVNSREAMVACGVPSQAWKGFLKAHEAYHKLKGEELPDKLLVDALTPEFEELYSGRRK